MALVIERRIGRRILDLETAVDDVVERVERGKRNLDLPVATSPSRREADVRAGLMERESALESGVDARSRRASQPEPYETAVQLQQALVPQIHVCRPVVVERHPRLELGSDRLVACVDAAAPVAHAARVPIPLGIVNQVEPHAHQVDLIVGVDVKPKALQDAAIAQPPAARRVAIENVEQRVVGPARKCCVQTPPQRVALRSCRCCGRQQHEQQCQADGLHGSGRSQLSPYLIPREPSQRVSLVPAT